MPNQRLTCCFALATTLSAGMFLTSATSVSANNYVIINQPVDGFLKELSRDSGERIQYGNEVRGRISNTSLSGSVPDILNRLSGKLDLDWFDYNGVFFVAKKADATTRIIRLGDLSFEDAMAALNKSDLVFDKFPISAMAEDSALSITGPPKLIAIVESVIEGIPSKKPSPRETAKKTITERRGIETNSVVVK